jgi:hypothetical protein
MPLSYPLKFLAMDKFYKTIFTNYHHHPPPPPLLAMKKRTGFITKVIYQSNGY